ncbi:hypothetical protein N7451_000169 [Penicillium sp. IBT 35674x]|nr:hypothetical protein N7451_000169 [Penicillium sp. IBT 35674x]
MQDWSMPYLEPDEWEKDCDGLLIKWSPKARENLQNDATRLGLDVNTLKAVAENLAWDSANRHGEKEVLIRGSVHSFMTSTRTRRTRPDGEHVAAVGTAALKCDSKIHDNELLCRQQAC